MADAGRPPSAATALRDSVRVAVVDLMAELGYEETTVEAIVARAGVERAEFDRCFSGRQDCVMRVYRWYTERFDALVYSAYRSEERWRDGFRAAAYAAARFIRDNPRVVRFGTVEMFGAGLMAQAERETHLHRLVDLIDAGRQELDDPSAIGRGVAEGVFGSIYEFIVKQVQSGGGLDSAESYVPDLMYLAVRPYLGHEIAREELAMAAPPERRVPGSTEAGHAGHGALAPSYGPAVTRGGDDGGEVDTRLARLPPGRHGLPRDFVIQNQRDRLAAGTIAVVAERGLNEATITQISAAAGVSRRTFYTYFSSKEDCYLATYKTVVDHLRLATDEAARAAEGWPAEVAAKLRAMLEFLAANPDLARFCLIAPQRAGEEIAGRHREAMSRTVGYLCEGMPPPPRTRSPSEAVAASLIGGMAALIVRHVEAGEGDALPDLLPDLLEIFLAPFLGREAAIAIARDL